MKKKIKRNIFGFILGILLFGIVGVYAVTTLQASYVTVDTTNMPNVGSNKTVKVNGSIVLTGEDAKNYDVSTPGVTNVNITPATLTVTPIYFPASAATNVYVEPVPIAVPLVAPAVVVYHH